MDEQKTLLPEWALDILNSPLPSRSEIERLLQALETEKRKVERAKEALSHPDLDDCVCQPDNPHMEVYTYTKQPKCGFCKVKQILKELEE